MTMFNVSDDVDKVTDVEFILVFENYLKSITIDNLSMRIQIYLEAGQCLSCYFATHTEQAHEMIPLVFPDF